MSSDTSRCRSQASAPRSWSTCALASIVLAIAATPCATAQTAAAGFTGQARHTVSDTIGTPGRTPVAPAFTEHPRDVATTAFVDASFTVACSGQPMPAVSWQFSSDGATWNDVPGATTTALVVRSPVVAHDGTHWRARLSAPGMAPLFSNVARLRVARATPAIEIAGLAQVADGTPRSVVVTTRPAGLRLTVRYMRDGVAIAEPIEPGSYTVVVEATGSNHHGTATATMIIAPN